MILTKEMENFTEEKATTQTLIKGEFQVDDAAEILNHMLMTKINFHERRNFSSQIRFGQNDEASLQRIKELEDSKSEIRELIQLARTNGLSMRISSNISIELI
ncbi:MAG: hypothetical protein RLN88_00135 [Ekhidna sp.]|uniref:hypothetical protein n=1 Tax=Ekhidna sp. TaxID=2608089 RepID=UPI0032EF60EF